ncbi:hypothetical protein XA68_14457 [Ophiocordyceps unilateralis]|uniref:Uncharacterized protein n=1 Tax=Ophiocordyceps unilateralis TaxID=268505 RepID=A0A2A9PAD5_OPHUN|nr:hypothetical protein XA68_14457 [Ophiocordyceps unilateralis]
MESASPPSDSRPTLSINQLARIYPRERLLVKPLFWTKRQLELLQVSFDQPRPAPPITRFAFTGEKSGEKVARSLLTMSLLTDRELAVDRVLANPVCPLKIRPNMFFHFGRRRRTLRGSNSLFLPQKSGTPTTVAVYIDEERIQVTRRHALRPKLEYSRGFSITYSLYEKKMKRITPLKSLHDPYIVALLIAAAQEQHGRGLAWKHCSETCPATFLSKVLYSVPKSDCLYLYTAEIPTPFIEMIFQPGVPPPTQMSIFIQVTTICYTPSETLRDRLLALLLPPGYCAQDGEQKRDDSTGVKDLGTDQTGQESRLSESAV